MMRRTSPSRIASESATGAGGPEARRPSPLLRAIVDPVPDFIRKAEWLKKVPLWLRQGPWSPLAFVSLAGLVGVLVAAAIQYHTRFALAPLSAPSIWLAGFRLSLGTLGALAVHHSWTVRKASWAWITYTMQSFFYLTFRLLLAGLAACMPQGSRLLAAVHTLAAILRGPALIQASITVSIWWLVLTPIIMLVLRSKPAQLKAFNAFNLSPFLLTIHGVNLPIAAMDFLCGGVPLGEFDLWLSAAIGVAYLIFYLLVLDANGVHLYIILSPRTSAVVLVHLLVMGLYVAFYVLWNRMLLVWQTSALGAASAQWFLG